MKIINGTKHPITLRGERTEVLQPMRKAVRAKIEEREVRPIHSTGTGKLRVVIKQATEIVNLPPEKRHTIIIVSSVCAAAMRSMDLKRGDIYIVARKERDAAGYPNGAGALEKVQLSG